MAARSSLGRSSVWAEAHSLRRGGGTHFSSSTLFSAAACITFIFLRSCNVSESPPPQHRPSPSASRARHRPQSQASLPGQEVFPFFRLTNHPFTLLARRSWIIFPLKFLPPTYEDFCSSTLKGKTLRFPGTYGVHVCTLSCDAMKSNDRCDNFMVGRILKRRQPLQHL